MRHPLLEGLLVSRDGGQERQASQIRQVVGPERRPKTLVAQALELLPCWLAGVTLQDVVPLLRGTREVERGEPHLVAFGSAMGAEEPVASIEPA